MTERDYFSANSKGPSVRRKYAAEYGLLELQRNFYKDVKDCVPGIQGLKGRVPRSMIPSWFLSDCKHKQKFS